MNNLLLKRKFFNHIKTEKSFDTIEQINSGSGRTYKVPSGAIYPSVTSVVGLLSRDAIMEWRKKVGEEEANKISSKAASRGTRIHELCENYIANVQDINMSRYDFIDRDNFSKLQMVLDGYIDNVHLQEARMWTDTFRMAGTVDCIAEFDGKLSVIDFKTSKKLNEKDWITGYFCQATAYAIMYEELTGIPVGRTVIIISVDDEEPQIFVEKRDTYYPQMKEIREKYFMEYGI
jgi:CRISPR/Cas system-associated exonuclease Cas4 (RecB family)